jgi:hypothetical protein
MKVKLYVLMLFTVNKDDCRANTFDLSVVDMKIEPSVMRWLNWVMIRWPSFVTLSRSSLVCIDTMTMRLSLSIASQTNCDLLGSKSDRTRILILDILECTIVMRR